MRRRGRIYFRRSVEFSDEHIKRKEKLSIFHKMYEERILCILGLSSKRTFFCGAQDHHILRLLEEKIDSFNKKLHPGPVLQLTTVCKGNKRVKKL